MSFLNRIPIAKAAAGGGGGGTIVFTDDADFTPTASPYLVEGETYSFTFIEEDYSAGSGNSARLTYVSTTGTWLQRDGDSNDDSWVLVGSLQPRFKLYVDDVKTESEEGTVAGRAPIGFFDASTKKALGLTITIGAGDGGTLTQFSGYFDTIAGAGVAAGACIVKHLPAGSDGSGSGAGHIIAVSRNKAIASEAWYDWTDFEDVSGKVFIEQGWSYECRFGKSFPNRTSGGETATMTKSTSSGFDRRRSIDFAAWGNDTTGETYDHTVKVTDFSDASATVSTLTGGSNSGQVGDPSSWYNLGFQFESGDKSGPLEEITVNVGATANGGVTAVVAQLILQDAAETVGYTLTGVDFTSTGNKTWSADWVSGGTTAVVESGGVTTRPHMSKGSVNHFVMECEPFPANGNYSILKMGGYTDAEAYDNTGGGAWSTTSNQILNHTLMDITGLSPFWLNTSTTTDAQVGHYSGNEKGRGSTVGRDTTGVLVGGPVGDMRLYVSGGAGGGASDLHVELRDGATPGAGTLLGDIPEWDLGITAGSKWLADPWVGLEATLQIDIDSTDGFTPDRSGSTISSTNATVSRVEVFSAATSTQPDMPTEVYATWAAYQGSTDSGDRYEWLKITFNPTSAGSPCSVDEISIATVSV